jgi:hypothetical protein
VVIRRGQSIGSGVARCSEAVKEGRAKIRDAESIRCSGTQAATGRLRLKAESARRRLELGTLNILIISQYKL